MWTQFSEGARRVVFFAQEEARRFEVRAVTPEHLLLGITHDADNNVAAVILQRMGIPPETLRRQILVNETLSRLAQGNKTSEQPMQLADASKRALDMAYEEAKELGNTYIGTEHMLAGIVRQGSGPAAQALAALGVDAPKLRQHILDYEEPGQEDTT